MPDSPVWPPPSCLSHNHTAVREICSEGWFPWTIFVIFGGWITGCQATIWCKNIPDKLNPQSRVHACHRRQTDRWQTDRRICHSISQTLRSHAWLKTLVDNFSSTTSATVLWKLQCHIHLACYDVIKIDEAMMCYLSGTTVDGPWKVDVWRL